MQLVDIRIKYMIVDLNATALLMASEEQPIEAEHFIGANLSAIKLKPLVLFRAGLQPRRIIARLLKILRSHHVPHVQKYHSTIVLLREIQQLMAILVLSGKTLGLTDASLPVIMNQRC